MKETINKNGLLYIWQKIKLLLASKVDKVEGKGLSTNDLTDELKQKILNAGDSTFDGQYESLTGKPKINNVEVNGELTLDALGIQPKGSYATKSEIPTVPTKVSAFTNDSNYQTATQVTTAISGAKKELQTAIDGKANATHTHTKSQITDMPTKLSQFTNDNGYQTSSQVTAAISNAVGKITSFETKVVTSLPTTGVKGTIYFVASKTTGTNQAYDEYLWVNNKWEFIGTTAVDLTGYLKATDIHEITNEEIDTIFAQ